MALLDIENLRVEFPGRRGTFVAVEDISLHLERGEILGVVGESGAGKSTIGTAVIGLLQPPGHVAAGRIALDGERIDQLPEHALKRIRGRRIGMIFQDPLTSLDPLQTIGRQLTETILTHLDLSPTQAHARALELLQRVGIERADERLLQYPHQFSGGMRQRVVIALALCCNPELIIADEPTTALDVSVQEEVLVLLRKLCREDDVGMVIITHDMGVIAETADRVAVLYRGHLMEQGPTRKILGHPDHAYTRSLIAAVPRADVKLKRFPLVGYVGDDAPAANTSAHAGDWLRGGEKFAPEGAGALLEVRDLRLSFTLKRAWRKSRRRELVAVDDVSFDIRPGEVFGLVGESGSGKSTIARLIAGLYRPDAGTIRYAGHALGGHAHHQAANLRRQIQMIFQDPFSSLSPRMRILDIIAEPIRFHHLASGRSEIRRIVSDLLTQVGLEANILHRFPHEFSGGQRQRICIARALATRPRFLLCDEPTSALDVSVQAQVLNILKDLQEELNLTLLFISHDLPVIRQMCDRVGVLRHGRLLELAATDTLFDHPQHEYTQHLLSLIPTMHGHSDTRLAPT